MKYPHAVDPDLHWTDHFAKYGFAIRKGLLSRSFCDAALDEVRRVIGQPPDSDPKTWQTPDVQTMHTPYRDGDRNEVFEKVFDEPGVRESIDTLFGDPDAWNGNRNYYLFLRPYEPGAKQAICERGHIDFGNQPIPILFRGFNFQASLVDTEPFSGNLTVHPGSHKAIQKLVMDDPDIRINSGVHPTVELEPPFEFVAEAGDVLFHSHMVVHSGNPSHADGHSPRIALHCDAYRDEWVTAVDPDDPGISPWERSLAQNGKYDIPYDEQALHVAFRQKQGDKQYL